MMVLTLLEGFIFIFNVSRLPPIKARVKREWGE
jgi:hypothetical protein